MRSNTYRLIMVLSIILASITIILMLLSYITEWEFAGIVDTNTNKYKTLWQWVDLLFVPVVIAIASAFFAKSQQRNEWTLKIRDEYDKHYKTLANFYQYSKGGGMQKLSDSEKIEMKTLGNWMDTVAILYNHRYLNRRLIEDIGLDQSVRKFYDEAKDTEIMKNYIERWNGMKDLYDRRKKK